VKEVLAKVIQNTKNNTIREQAQQVLEPKPAATEEVENNG